MTKRPAWTGSASRIPSEQPPVDVPERIVVAPVKAKKPIRKKAASDGK